LEAFHTDVIDAAKAVALGMIKYCRIIIGQNIICAVMSINGLQHNSILYFLVFVFFTIMALSEGCYGCNIYSMLGSAEPVKTVKTM